MDEIKDIAQRVISDLMNKDTIVDNRTIYTAAVINTRTGNIQASDITNIVGNDNVVSFDVRNMLREITAEVERLLQPTMTKDCKDLICEIKDAISSELPKLNFLKRCFQALKGFASDVATTIVSGQVIKLSGKALSVL